MATEPEVIETNPEEETKSPETPESDTPPSEEPEEEIAKEEEPKEEDKETSPKPEEPDPVQKRIDKLTAEKYALERQLKEVMSKQAEPQDPNAFWTKERVLLALDKEEYKENRPWLLNRLSDLNKQEVLQEIRQERLAETKKFASIEQAAKIYPELKDANSQLWQTANQIYIDKKLESFENGPEIAATLAWNILNQGKMKDNKVFQKRLDKETAKKTLAGTSRKAVVSDSASVNKLIDAGGDDNILQALRQLNKNRKTGG